MGFSIAIKEYDKTVTVEFDKDDVTSDEVIETMVDALVSIGYHQESIKRSIIELAEEYSYTEELMDDEEDDDSEEYHHGNVKYHCGTEYECIDSDGDLEGFQDVEELLDIASKELDKIKECKYRNGNDCCANNNTLSKECKKDLGIDNNYHFTVSF